MCTPLAARGDVTPTALIEPVMWVMYHVVPKSRYLFKLYFKPWLAKVLLFFIGVRCLVGSLF